MYTLESKLNHFVLNYKNEGIYYLNPNVHKKYTFIQNNSAHIINKNL